MRLQKFLAHSGVCSRRAAEKLILEGRVKVNDQKVIAMGEIVNPDSDTVLVDDKKVDFENKKLFLFHKPKGVVSTLSDPHNKKDLKQYVALTKVRAFPVGRLDRDAFGLMLLTNDGEFANKMLHPSFETERVYYLLVNGGIDQEDIKQAKLGLELRDGMAKASLTNIKYDKSIEHLFDKPSLNQSLVRASLTEGRKHIVKRIMKNLGSPVIELCRYSHGSFMLDKLRPGEILEVENYEDSFPT